MTVCKKYSDTRPGAGGGGTGAFVRQCQAKRTCRLPKALVLQGLLGHSACDCAQKAGGRDPGPGASHRPFSEDVAGETAVSPRNDHLARGVCEKCPRAGGGRSSDWSLFWATVSRQTCISLPPRTRPNLHFFLLAATGCTFRHFQPAVLISSYFFSECLERNRCFSLPS